MNVWQFRKCSYANCSVMKMVQNMRNTKTIYNFLDDSHFLKLVRRIHGKMFSIRIRICCLCMTIHVLIFTWKASQSEKYRENISKKLHVLLSLTYVQIVPNKNKVIKYKIFQQAREKKHRRRVQEILLNDRKKKSISTFFYFYDCHRKSKFSNHNLLENQRFHNLENVSMLRTRYPWRKLWTRQLKWNATCSKSSKFQFHISTMSIVANIYNRWESCLSWYQRFYQSSSRHHCKVHPQLFRSIRFCLHCKSS